MGIDFLAPEKVKEGNEIVRRDSVESGWDGGVQMGKAALAAEAARTVVDGKFEAKLHSRPSRRVVERNAERRLTRSGFVELPQEEANGPRITRGC